MYLEIKQFNSRLLEEAKDFFSDDYIFNKTNESIFSRYLISKEFQKQENIHYLPMVDSDWIPVFFDKNYWSISHKKWLVFIWISKNKLWVDIEKYKERDISLLIQFDDSEYEILWWKNWNNFYILWTAKESIIKYNLCKLDDIKNMNLILYNNINTVISWITFTRRLVIIFNWVRYEVLNWIKWKNFYSICI